MINNVHSLIINIGTILAVVSSEILTQRAVMSRAIHRHSELDLAFGF